MTSNPMFARPRGAHGLLRAACAVLALLLPAWTLAQVPANPYSYSRTSSFTYKTNGVLETETVEPDQPNLCVTTSYIYDANGNKTSATTANCAGASGRAPFDARTSGSVYGTQTVSVAGVAGVVIPLGQFATSATNALNQSESRVYDPRFGAVTSLTGPNGLTTAFAYDDLGRKTLETRADGTKSETRYCILASTGLDTSSNSSGCTDTPLSGRSDEIPAGTVSYVQGRQLSASGAPMGSTARAYKDAQGRTIREITEGFDGSGQPASRSYVVKDTFYNAQGVAYLSTAPYYLETGSSTLTGSNDAGLTLTTVDALGRTVRVDVRDPLGNSPSVVFGSRGSFAAATTTVTYSGLATTTTNPKGQQRTEEKNADGKLVRVTDAYGAQLVHQHDAFGNLIQTKDALQNLLVLSYDIRGRKTGMVDPDTGTWAYDYNALGELVWQRGPNQAANGTATTMAYDKLGRMTSRVEPEYTSSWTYDSCTKGVGKLCESNTSHGVNKKVAYDSLGRPVNSRTTVSNGPSFATQLDYEPGTGRVLKQTYPTGVAIQFAYSSRGFVTQVQLATAATVAPLPGSPGGTPVAGKSLPAGTALWTAGGVNAWGKAETQTLDNGVVSRASFEPATGRVLGLNAGPGSSSTVLNHAYTWDSLNNLQKRIDAIGDGNSGWVQEDFQYDSINRLTQYKVKAQAATLPERTVDLYYNAVGNLLYKSDVGNYEYPAFGNNNGVSNPKPHAVSRIVGTSFGTVDYQYDANGNMVSASGGKYRSVSYTSFNLPDSNTGMAGAGGSPRYTWQYDESHQRIKETRVNGSGTRTTWYQHPDNQGGLSFESETGPSGGTSNRHYVSAGGQVIVLVTTGALPVLPAGQVTPPSLTATVTFVKVEYWHKDHLGSLAATTDHAGNVTARYAYDPFGKRRLTNGTYDAFGAVVVDWADDVNSGTDRGFTGHEHLDDLGVVHMNGRIFDPAIARFMQGDPLIQAPDDLQSYNRFTYCMSNPTGCTDPSGYSWLSKTFSSVVNSVVRLGYEVSGLRFFGVQYKDYRTMASIAAAIAIGPNGFAFQFGGLYGQAAVAGFVSGAIASGNIQGALQGSFSAVLFAGVGDGLRSSAFRSAIDSSAGRFFAAVALHGVAGCLSAEVAGGHCGSGALSAAFTKAATFIPGTSQLGRIEGAVASAVIGGTASTLGGGTFANGAATGAFSYIFNEASRPRQVLLTQAFNGRTASGVAYRVEAGVDVRLIGVFAANDGLVPGIDPGAQRITIEAAPIDSPMLTSGTGNIVVNNSMLRNLSFGDLQSMLAHEQVHIVQYRKDPMIIWNYSGREVPAYQFQVENYDKFNKWERQTIPKSAWEACVVRSKAGSSKC